MDNVQVQNKIKMLFEKIAEPNYIMNNYYADGLINKLANCSDPEISFLKSVPLVSDLIIDALNRTQNADNAVKVFLTRFLAIVSQKELHFAKMFSKKGDEIAKSFKEINSPVISSSLRVAYMEVALALVHHNSGISWLLETGVWKEILSLCDDKQTVFVVRQTYKFASKFLWKLNDLGDESSIRLIVVGHILRLVNEIDFVNVQSMTAEEENEISKTLEPMLQMLLSVVTESGRIEKPSILIALLLKDYKLTSHLLVIFDRMRREDVTLLITKLVFWLAIAKMFLAKPVTEGVMYTREDLMDTCVIYFNTVQMLIQRRSATLVLDYCNVCNLIWTSLWKDKEPAMVECDGRQIKLQNKLLLICLVPCLVYVKKIGKNMCLMTYEKLNEYITKLLNSTCEHTARAAYALRDLTLEQDTQSITLQSVKRLTCLKSHLNNEQANLVFQALFYILKEYEPLDDNGDMKLEETFEDSQEKVLVMTYVLDTVLCLVKNHDINWHESLEVICLFSVVHSILKRPNLSCKFVVTALNLVAVTVKKFIPPNLSLLLESKPGSAMHEIGKLIYLRMHDINWEVRDSALELLLVCTEISFIKFPPFQKQLLENDLINVAATIAFNDYEFYVQVSALKCLGAASKINTLWERLTTQYPNIKEQIIAILRNNQEGIVRKEACNLLCDMYQNIKMTPACKQVFYEHMVSSAVSDFHWEVQQNALRFWRIVIQSLLTGQGMLDGTFPPVTFSRETRKIVTLNEAEIQKRLLRVLDELASIGCLTVLVKLLHDDSDVDTMESALLISLELLNILNKYKVPECLKQNDTDPKSVEELMCNIKEENDESNNVEDISEPQTLQKADNVIEAILNADDINLLASIYERHMNIQSGKSEVPVKPKIKLLKCASPHLFVSYLKSKDFKAIVDQQKKWKEGIRSISSLLDDVLGIYDMNDAVNSLDCY